MIELNDFMTDLKEKADAGDADAQFELGWQFINYSCEPPYDKDCAKEGIYYYELAAGQGHLDAMLDLGGYYMDGTGVKADFDKAVYWYKKAADELYPKAFRCLGYAYGFHGFNDNFHDYEAAFKWFVKGALLGEQNCLYELGDLYYYGRYVEEDKKLAAVLYQRSYDVIDGEIRDDSYADVCMRLGICYLNGDGVEQDDAGAKKYLEEAKAGYEYRLKRDYPGEWFDNITSELDRVKKLLKDL